MNTGSRKYIELNFSDRIGGKNFGVDDESQKKKKNKFVKILEAKNAVKKDHPDIEILDFGVGEADDMVDSSIRDELKKEVDVFDNRGYADNGIKEFKQVAAKYMSNQYDVKLKADTQVNHCIGAKSGLAILPYVFINPGDFVIVTVPGYPIFGTNTEYLGGKVYKLPLRKERNFIADFSEVPEDVLKKTKVININYPNSPTGTVVNEDYYKEIIKIAKKYNIAIVQDAAYIGLVYNSKPLSILSVEGAMDVAVEVHSMSKLFNMTGWRMGFVCGNEHIVKAFAMLKDNIDCGQFKAIQKASIKALENPNITKKLVEKYKNRLTKMVNILKNAGFDVKMPGGSYFIYTEMPKGIKNGKKFNNAEEFSQWLIKEKQISTVPWDDSGHFIRLSSTFVAENENDENRILDEFKNRLMSIDFEF
jgi:LL-diaminopimelate aminotransferase